MCRTAPARPRDQQKAEVEKVLAELEVQDKPRLEVLNKVDLLANGERGVLNPDAIAISARTGEGLDALLARIDEALVLDPITRMTLEVPQQEGAILAALEAGAVIHDREFQGQSVRIEVSAPDSLLGRYRRFWVL